MPSSTRIPSFFRTRKANIFILFLFLSMLFLVLTKLSKDYTQTVKFQLNKTQVPENKVVIQDSTHHIDVTITTYGFKFLRYFISKPTLDLSFDELDKNDQFFIWTKDKGYSGIVSQFDSDIKINAVNPDTLWFRYDTNFIKKVPVVLESEIQYSGGFNIVETIKLNPDSIKVVGPKTMVDSILDVKTEILKLEDVNRNINADVNLILPDSSIEITYSHQLVNVSGQVEKFTEGSIDVPIIIKNVPDHIKLNYYPKEISVVYYTSLSNFKNITANSFIVSCDYKNLKEGDSFLVPQILDIPEGIKGVKLSPNKVEFIIIQ